MLFQSFLIKYAEIGTKGKNRFLFEDALMKQIRHALKEVDGTFTISKESGRIYVDAEGDYDYDEAIEAMKRVLGIAWICPMFQMEKTMYIRRRILFSRWMQEEPIRSIRLPPRR